MQNLDTYQLIRRLKSKPRQGAGLASYLLQATSAANAFAGKMTSLNDANVQLQTGIDKQIGANEVLINRFKELTQESLKLELRNKAINDSFGVSSQGAAKLSQAFHTLAKDLSVSGKLMMQYGAGIKSIIPTLNQAMIGDKYKGYYKGLVAVQKVLTTNLKLSSQQAEEYTYYATQQGQNAANTLLATQAITKALGDDGTMGYFKIAAAGIAKAGAAIQLQFGRIPGNLELAVLKAHSLGLEVADLRKTSDNLLNIESSIGEELEYQLLSGRRLVGNEKAKAEFQGKSLTNLYRTAAIQGDMNKQSDILNQILEQEGSTLETNLFARQQMAKLLGLEEGQLARALQKKKLLQESGAEVLFEFSGKELEAQAKAMMDAGQLTKDAFDKIMTMEDTRTTDEILDESLQVQQESLLADYLMLKQLTAIHDTRGAVTRNATELKLIKYLEEEATALGTDLLAVRNMNKDSTVLLKEMKENTGGKDFYETPGTQTVVTDGSAQDALVINDGLIKFHPNDKFMSVNDGAMIAGTNVDGNRKLAASINGAGMAITNSHISQLIQAFNEMGQLIKASIDMQTATLKRDNLFAPGINGATWG